MPGGAGWSWTSPVRCSGPWGDSLSGESLSESDRVSADLAFAGVRQEPVAKGLVNSSSNPEGGGRSGKTSIEGFSKAASSSHGPFGSNNRDREQANGVCDTQTRKGLC